MCGIAGFFGNQNNNDLSVLKSMLKKQVHRGPDAEGYIYENCNDYHVALGHRRLSIIDTSDFANQPMMYENLTIVYNGEVYNFKEIRQELIHRGYRFISEGDTEVVLKAFHCWDVKAVSKFRGMFSFCIYDKNRKKVYLIRDRVGVKPLYYSHIERNLVFSSEIKSLRCHSSFKSSICKIGMSLYFQYGYITAPWTIFEGTKKVRPGHYMEYDLTTNMLVEKKYWEMATFYNMPKEQYDEVEAGDQLYKILKESFALRMISDVPVGVLLSGGIDSSLVTSVLQADSSNQIKTFTMGFDTKKDDESEYARKIANHLGTDHYEERCAWNDAEDIIYQLPKMYDEPFADSSAIPTALISKFAKQSVSVILSGDGGDEMFCGYNTYPLSEKRFNYLSKIPFKKALGKLLEYIPDPIMGMYDVNYDYYSRYLKFKASYSYQSIEEKYKAIIRTFMPYDIKKMFFNNELAPISSSILHEVHTLERMMLIDFNHYLPDDILTKVDRATMYYSLEGREPLLDHKILEFAARLPVNLKKNKYILKNLLERFLPREYFERKKHGFGVPVNKWLKSELRHLLTKYLNPIKLKQQGIFNPNYVNRLCGSFLRSNSNDNRIWTLLMFQMWYEEYFSEIF